MSAFGGVCNRILAVLGCAGLLSLVLREVCHVQVFCCGDYAEDGFLVTPITGRWLKGLDSRALGNPLPDILGDTYSASLQVTDLNGGLFSFTSINIASGTINAPVEFTLVGMLAGDTVFSTTGEAPYPFITVNSPSGSMIDTLTLSMVRLTAEGYEVDNIRLNEPARPRRSDLHR